MSEPINARTQTELAESGHAVGQCPECGSYRSDGMPPVLHRRDCSHRDDWRRAAMDIADGATRPPVTFVHPCGYGQVSPIPHLCPQCGTAEPWS